MYIFPHSNFSVGSSHLVAYVLATYAVNWIQEFSLLSKNVLLSRHMLALLRITAQ
jgi:hypothetical protein